MVPPCSGHDVEGTMNILDFFFDLESKNWRKSRDEQNLSCFGVMLPQSMMY